MPGVKVPVSTSDEIRERIIDGAREACGRWGVARTRMDDIARQTGISRSNLYNYFANKEDLINAVMLQTAERIDAHFEKNLPLKGASKDLFLKRLVGGIEIAMTDELTRDIHAIESDRANESPVTQWWAAAFSYARSRGEFRRGLSDEDALRWVIFVQRGVLENLRRFEGLDDIAEFLKTFAVMPLLATP